MPGLVVDLAQVGEVGGVLLQQAGRHGAAVLVVPSALPVDRVYPEPAAVIVVFVVASVEPAGEMFSTLYMWPLVYL